MTSAPLASRRGRARRPRPDRRSGCARRASRGGSRRSRAAASTTRSTTAEDIAKPMPIEPPFGERIAVFTPITSPVHVEERPAGVAAVDRGVGLDEVVVAALQRAVARRDDAGGDREALAERVADGQHPVADLRRVAVAEARRRAAASSLSTFRSAMSVRGSRPTSSASSSPPSKSSTVISSALSMTWLLVTM